MVRKANQKRLLLIIGGDANAHHTIRGNTNTNQSGDCILDFILNYNLALLNQMFVDTFVVPNITEVLDIYLINGGQVDLIENWSVLKVC